MVIYHIVKPPNNGVEGTKCSKECQGTEPKSANVRFLATLGSVIAGFYYIPALKGLNCNKKQGQMPLVTCSEQSAMDGRNNR